MLFEEVGWSEMLNSDDTSEAFHAIGNWYSTK
jgi:hypothetical protein